MKYPRLKPDLPRSGFDIGDVLDYRFRITEKKVVLKIHRGPELFDVEIRKPEYDDIGLEFDTFLMDEKRSCRNKCVFCFIDQNPHGMRDTIYFKDDDRRLSFLHNYYKPYRTGYTADYRDALFADEYFGSRDKSGAALQNDEQ